MIRFIPRKQIAPDVTSYVNLLNSASHITIVYAFPEVGSWPDHGQCYGMEPGACASGHTIMTCIQPEETETEIHDERSSYRRLFVSLVNVNWIFVSSRLRATHNGAADQQLLHLCDFQG